MRNNMNHNIDHGWSSDNTNADTSDHEDDDDDEGQDKRRLRNLRRSWRSKVGESVKLGLPPTPKVTINYLPNSNNPFESF